MPADAFTTITLQARDFDGINLTTGGLYVTLVHNGSSGVNLSGVDDNGDGTYSASITNTVAELVSISAEFGNNAADVVDVSFGGVVSAAHSTLTLSASPARVPADGVTPITITIQTKDISGVNLTTGGLNVSIISDTPNHLNFSDVADHGDGTYSVTATSTLPGSVGIFASFGGSGIGFILSFTGFVASAAHSTLSANPTSVPADEVTPITIVLQAKDSHGINLTTGGLNVTLAHNGSSGVNLSGVADHGDGTYSAIMTNTVIEDVTISAEFGGNPVVDTVDVTFRPLSSMFAGGIWYDGVTIGTQTWTAENMRHAASFGYTRSYDDDVNNDANGYGKLYSGTAAMKGIRAEGIQGICGVGWHIPSDNDWKILEGHLGMTQAEQDVEEYRVYRGTDQGTQLKAGGGSGFEALLAGRFGAFFFIERGTNAYFWSSTSEPLSAMEILYGITYSQNSYARYLSSGNAGVERYTYQSNSTNNLFSVRCLKN